MELIIFIGVQASGKTSFYLKEFFDTHLHISLDKLKTRNREKLFMQACFDSQQAFVIDNTSPTLIDRSNYIKLAKNFGYKVSGYYFASKIEECLKRNSLRQGEKRIPDLGIRGTHSKLVLPSFSEGFDELKYVSILDGEFKVIEWNDEI